MKVLCFGYRGWSFKIFNCIQWPFSTAIHSEKDKVNKEYIDKINPDVILFYGWSWMVPADIVNNYFCVGLHPSPLPKYKGGSPIQNQIQCGETISAVTLFRMTEELDAGDILFQKEISLDGHIDDIFKRIIDVGYEGTISLLRRMHNNEIPLIVLEQHGEATIYKRLKNNSEITINDLQNMSAKQLYDKIRMLSGFYPNAYIKCKDGRKLYFEKVRLEDK